MANVSVIWKVWWVVKGKGYEFNSWHLLNKKAPGTMAWLTVRGTRAWDRFPPSKGNIPMAVKGRAAIYGSRNLGSFIAPPESSGKSFLRSKMTWVQSQLGQMGCA